MNAVEGKEVKSHVRFVSFESEELQSRNTKSEGHLYIPRGEK